MLIIHAAFADNSFYLWGERSFDVADLERAEGSSSLPWCADVGGVIEALREAGLKSAKKYTDKQAVSAFVTLPSCGGLPLPSSRLLGELPEQQGETELRVYQINALPVSREDMADGCLALAHSDGERLAVPGLLLADDVRYMSKALEFAALYAARGAFVPDMETRGSCFYSVWKPLFLAKYQDEYKTFIEAAPPVLLGFSTEPGAQLKNRAEVARPIFEIFLDGLVRDAQNALGARGRKVDPDNPHEIWLRALTWPSAPLDRWGEAMESLYPQIRAWSGSLETVTSQAWRLFMRLEEPSEDEQDIWTLSWHIQSVQDPSLVIPAARVWAPGPAERAWFSHVGANPRRYMLAMLGHLASFVPAIARSLDKACPVDCRLNLDELFEFLRDHVPSILDQGIQIQLPATWGSLSERPRLAVHGTVRDAAARLKPHLNEPGEYEVEESPVQPERVKFDMAKIRGDAFHTYANGAVAVAVEVDRSTGKVTVKKLSIAQDSGTPIDRRILEGQIAGGLIQGLGFALGEEFYEGRTGSLHDYVIPTFEDQPPLSVHIIDDCPYADGPFGAKCAGEITTVGVGAALLEAVSSAIGRPVRRLPVTSEQILSLLEGKDDE